MVGLELELKWCSSAYLGVARLEGYRGPAVKVSGSVATRNLASMPKGDICTRVINNGHSLRHEWLIRVSQHIYQTPVDEWDSCAIDPSDCNTLSTMAPNIPTQAKQYVLPKVCLESSLFSLHLPNCSSYCISLMDSTT